MWASAVGTCLRDRCGDCGARAGELDLLAAAITFQIRSAELQCFLTDVTKFPHYLFLLISCCFFFCSPDSNFSFYLSNVLIYVDQIAFSSGVPESKLTFLKNSHKELNEPYKLHTLAIVWARLLHLCIACSTRVLVQSTWATSARLECSQLCKKQWTLTYVEPHISPGCLRVGRIIFPLGVPMNCAFLKCIWLEKCNCDVLQHFST